MLCGIEEARKIMQAIEEAEEKAWADLGLNQRPSLITCGKGAFHALLTERTSRAIVSGQPTMTHFYGIPLRESMFLPPNTIMYTTPDGAEVWVQHVAAESTQDS